MSNVKVEKRKQEKYNRKKIEAAKKRKNIIFGVASLVVVIALAAVLGIRIYDDYFKYDATSDIDPNGISNAVSAVQQGGYEEPEEEEDKKDDAEADKKDDAEADKKDEAEADKKDDAEADKKDDAEADKKDDAEADKKDDAEADKKDDAEADKKDEE